MASLERPEEELIQINFDILMYDLPCTRLVFLPFFPPGQVQIPQAGSVGSLWGGKDQ